MRYEFSYETATSSGSAFVTADSADQAEAQFCEDWEEHGDSVPSHWITATWSVEGGK
jgi:hypothetical protein